MEDSCKPTRRAYLQHIDKDGVANTEYQWKIVVNQLVELASSTSDKDREASMALIYLFPVFETVCLYLL